MTDSAITSAVQGSLASDQGVRGSRIRVDTANGIVTLSGTVPTAAEKVEAESLASRTTGVRQVVSNIRVEQAQPAPNPSGTPQY
jgi:hyperosmotically inducible protein